MINPNYEKLAANMVGHSVNLKKGERVLIHTIDTPSDMTIALVRAARARGAEPNIFVQDSRVLREYIVGAKEHTLKDYCQHALKGLKKMDAYIAIRGAHNIFETSDIPADALKRYFKAMKPLQDYRVKKTRWVVTRWPSPSMAQLAQMSSEAFEDFFFRVTTFDYKRMLPGMKALKSLMEKTDQVHIEGPGTDLRFSIKDIPAIMCYGTHNIPDGEVFSAPVKTSVEGTLSYNTPTVYQGSSFDNVQLKFKKGKIVEATSTNTKLLNKILDSDAGARYIGEFAIGVNPHIREPMRDILFDEKIAGSFHFTPGEAYEDADNGNRSQVHWDMVCIQRKDYGGGTIKFDGKTIRKDGLFVPKSLHKLNPSQLLGKKK